MDKRLLTSRSSKGSFPLFVLFSTTWSGFSSCLALQFHCVAPTFLHILLTSLYFFPFCCIPALYTCCWGMIELSVYWSPSLKGFRWQASNRINIDNLLRQCRVVVYKWLSVLMWCGTLKHLVIRQNCLTCHPCRFSSRAVPLFILGGMETMSVCLKYTSDMLYVPRWW